MCLLYNSKWCSCGDAGKWLTIYVHENISISALNIARVFANYVADIATRSADHFPRENGEEPMVLFWHAIIYIGTESPKEILRASRWILHDTCWRYCDTCLLFCVFPDIIHLLDVLFCDFGIYGVKICLSTFFHDNAKLDDPAEAPAEARLTI